MLRDDAVLVVRFERDEFGEQGIALLDERGEELCEIIVAVIASIDRGVDEHEEGADGADRERDPGTIRALVWQVVELEEDRVVRAQLLPVCVAI